VDHFLTRFSGLYGKAITGVDSRAMKRLLALQWPGNIRQLENFLEQAVVLAEGPTLTERDLFTGDLADPAPGSTTPAGGYEPGLPLHEVERRHILQTLQKVNGNRTEAARLLQISVRCLQYKLKAYVSDPQGSRELSV
jgi:DNA-binding NtrC family response regulator